MTDTWTQADVRSFFDRLSDQVKDWQGVPVMLGEDVPLTLAEGHPLRDVYAELNQAGGVDVQLVTDDRPEFACGADDVCEEERVVNEWYCRARQIQVLVIDRGGRRFSLTYPVSPDRSMDRLNLWMQTIGAADAWDLAAEGRARDTLRAMLTERQWHHYDLTGSFFETSPRSRVTYILRRLRPTLALTPRWPESTTGRPRPESMKCLAVLCLHPIGYYQKTWAGCMVPTDDVIAHLAMIRADEAFYWRKANAHAPSSPEAGL